jgi:hypothetical protein
VTVAHVTYVHKGVLATETAFPAIAAFLARESAELIRTVEEGLSTDFMGKFRELGML